jgi:hypothetical protein
MLPEIRTILVASELYGSHAIHLYNISGATVIILSQVFDQEYFDSETERLNIRDKVFRFPLSPFICTVPDIDLLYIVGSTQIEQMCCVLNNWKNSAKRVMVLNYHLHEVKEAVDQFLEAEVIEDGVFIGRYKNG